jgi:hypothetical protein
MNQHASSFVSTRSKLAKEISAEIQQKFNANKTCDDLWDILVQKDKKHAGSGSYGDVWVVRLRSKPSFPIVIKRTKRLDVHEVKHSLMAGALAEVGANPHFNIMFGHFHCETLKTKFIPGRDMSWKDGERQLMQLYGERQQSKNEVQIRDIDEKMKNIEQRMYPRAEEIEKLRLFKNQKEKQLQEKYRTVLPYERNDPQLLIDLNLIDSLTETYEYMQEIRIQQYTTYELIFMEMSEGKFADLIDQNAPIPVLISSICQVCLGFLSYTSFFGFVQNDMHMGNVMYNIVDPHLFYVYKIGDSYIQLPIYGMLMKIIDFGLSTNVRNFNKPPRLGKPPTHWCPGGRGIGSDDQLECSVYMRDVLEFFYHLSRELHNISLQKWAKYAHSKAQQVTKGSVKTLIQFIIEVFHSDTLKKFDLPPVIQMTKTPIQIDYRYQTEPFEITNRKKYMNDIHNVIADKVWKA